MPFQPSPLPCDAAAFAPHLSAAAVDQHRRAQRAGIDALNAMLDPATGDDEAPTLAALAVQARGALAARAAQAWSEDFHWAALRPPPPGDAIGPTGALADTVARDFGDPGRMRERFAEAAGRLTGPGWVWLVLRRDGRLAILATPQSVTPLTGADTPLLAACLWPHAWTQDGAEARDRYLAGMWKLVDWKVVASRMPQARASQ
ncbi:Fe-Mn family superoxide dismutase [Luteimonas kalidii]|uniref:Fe-Mn family superoxide dismutase n=1 Tax=Luteimonas kalidii TaxID=3042025 RepID=A0ABT6JXV5_9GAMM|nr:Fe-Mn family superoxide dismutase [Luteimonas kalidii]MDH5835538.1 Fe-Mn family superoxide dismutase [Luteimonas kalidii]